MSITLDIPASASKEIIKIKNQELFSSECAEINCFVRFKVQQNGKELNRAHMWPITIKN